MCYFCKLLARKREMADLTEKTIDIDKILMRLYGVSAIEDLLEDMDRTMECDPRDGSPPGSDVPGILQARTLEWAAISFSNA